MTYLAEAEPGNALTVLQAASCTYRVALGPRAGEKMLHLQSVVQGKHPTQAVNAHGFSKLGAGLHNCIMTDSQFA